jgi:hypothetical protein
MLKFETTILPYEKIPGMPLERARKAVERRQAHRTTQTSSKSPKPLQMAASGHCVDFPYWNGNLEGQKPGKRSLSSVTEGTLMGMRIT